MGIVLLLAHSHKPEHGLATPASEPSSLRLAWVRSTAAQSLS